MAKKFKIAHLTGITREHEEQFRSAEKVLTEMGYIVFAPVFYDYAKYKSFGEWPNMLDEMCSQKLELCDFLVIVTPEHVGKSTSLRIKQAKAVGKPVYVLQEGQLLPFRQEGEDQDELQKTEHRKFHE